QRADANCGTGCEDAVVPVGAVDGHGVGLTIAAVAGVPEVQEHHAHAGAGQVVDGDGVGPAPGKDVDDLQAVHVHRHPIDVAGEPHPRAVRREGDVLVRAVAEEPQRVVAVLPVHRVAAVARAPGEPVVAGAPKERVVPRTPVDEVGTGAAVDPVVAGAAEQRVEAGDKAGDVSHGAAGQDVVAGAAVESRLRQAAGGLVRRGDVVAAAAGHDDLARIGDGRLPALNHDGAVIHEDRPGRVAGDHDGVVQIIAGHRQHAGRGGKGGGDRRQDAFVQRFQR